MEQFVLNTKKVKQVVDANNVVTITADFTDKDPEIAELLKVLGVDNSGLPVLAIFPAGNPNRPKVITGTYSQAHLIKVLESATPSVPAMTSTTQKSDAPPVKSARKPGSTDLSNADPIQKADEADVETADLNWEAFSTERLKKEQVNSPVLVSFTADWDATCKLFEQNVLNTEKVKKVLDAYNYVTLQAMYTNRDFEIEHVLGALGARFSFPVVAVFPVGGESPSVIEGFCTQDELIKVLNEIEVRSQTHRLSAR